MTFRPHVPPRFLLALLVASTPLAAARPAAAQGLLPDSLLESGQVAPAESLYFAYAASNPRDPIARAALGRYLGARGAARVGAVLLEEARFFGGDARAVAIDLAPLYRALGDYRALVTLPASPLSMTERAQAAWLASHPPTLQMPDSLGLPYTPSGDGLGTVTIRVGGRALTATIDPHRSGLVLDASATGDTSIRVFRVTDAPTITGVASVVRLGDLVLGNVPATIEPVGPTRAVIGLDVLRAFAPTFEPMRKRILLRRSGRVSPDLAGIRVPVLFEDDDVRVLRGDHFTSAGDAGVAQTLRSRRWTLDARRGEVVLAP